MTEEAREKSKDASRDPYNKNRAAQIITDNDLQFMLVEYKCLREEIQARLLRISKLVTVLLTSSLVYVTSIFIPIRILGSDQGSSLSASSFSVMEPVLIVYFALIVILPFISFAIEIMCTSEADAITRTGIYIRANIERKIRTTGYRGWEDWLDRQDKALRRRTSEKIATISRYFIIALYCITSAIIAGSILSRVFELPQILGIAGMLTVYGAVGFGVYRVLFQTKTKELAPNFYDILIVDIDGCLTDSTGNIPKKNIESIAAVRQLGVKIVLATGRSAYGAWPIAEKLEVAGQHVVSHGACIASWPDRVNSVVAEIQPSSIGHLVRELNAAQVSWAAFGESEIYCLQGFEEDLEKALRARKDIVNNEVMVRPIKNLDSWSWADCGTISKFWCNVNISEVTKSKELEAIEISGIQVSRTTNETIEFFSSGASKVEALKQILGEDVQSDEDTKILMLGDHDNDLDVMNWADHALAPANASIAVRNLAVRNVASVDVFDVTSDEEFVAEALRSYYDIKI